MRWVAVLVAVLAVAVSIPRAAAEGSYSPPVDGAIVDHFRPPSTPYGPGNRGVDFQTNPGDPVRAAADGEVVFAGRVGFSQHVVVLHPDGLRTSYSFLTEVDVQRGDRVHRGDVVGRSGNELHFGVRAGDKYLDPEPLLAGAPPDVHLIPVEDRKPGSILSEVLGLAAGISGTVIHASAKGVQWAGEQVVDAGTAAYDLVVDQARSVIAIVDAFQYYSGLPYLEAEKLARSGLFYDAQRHCTPASVAPGVEAGGRHIAVLVGGLGSSSTSANILDIDTRALGYAHDDVAVFSYAGGQTGGTRHLSGVAQHDYDTKDADEDLRTSAKRLRDLLVSIRLTHPGVPVDIIAHSQGGLVVRDALGEPGDESNPTLPTIDHVITLASPHHGANLATGNQWIGTSTPGQVVQVALKKVGLDVTSPAVRDLSERSSFIAEVDRRPLPAGARVTSIVASGDVVVPGLQGALDGATNVMVPMLDSEAHLELPGSAAARREMALALADEGPTCHDPTADIGIAFGIGAAEDIAGGALGAAGQWVSRWIPRAQMVPSPVPTGPGGG